MRGRLQIVYGVLTSTEGIPVAVEVFKGSTGDPATLASQVTKLKERFGLAHVALVGDRGMITKARIKDDLQPAKLDWVTALRGPAIKALMAGGAIQPTLFDDTDMAEITSPDYPGERLIACYNPFLAADRARKRGELLAATEAELAKIDAATRRARRPLRGQDAIALAVGKVINAKKVAKHFIVQITDDGLAWRRDEDKIAAEAALDGIYVIRTSLPPDALGTGGGAVLQGTGKRRAGVPRPEHRPADPADPAPARRPGPRPRADPAARLLRHLAHAGQARAHAVQGR